MNHTPTDQTRQRSTPVVERPAEIYLAGPPELDLSPITAVLQEAGLGERQQPGRRQERAPQLITSMQPDWLNYIRNQLDVQGGSAHLLLIYRAAVSELAGKMENDLNPAEGLDQWQREAATILEICRRYRRRITLFEYSAMLADPVKSIQILNQRLNLSLHSMSRPTQHTDQIHNPVYRLIAERAVQQDIDARHMAAELEASAIPIDSEDEFEQMDLSSVFKTFRQQQELTPELKQRYQQEIDQIRSEKAEIEGKLEGVRDLKEENELLLMQLHQVQEELEAYYLESRDVHKVKEERDALAKGKKKIERELKRTRQKLEKKQHQLDYVHNSKSWKLTVPLRKFLKLFSRSKNRKST